jgi:hypothetical protein
MPVIVSDDTGSVFPPTDCSGPAAAPFFVNPGLFVDDVFGDIVEP